jgi:hypothetical protein
MEMKASIQCAALVLPYGVKQAAKRQAKQCAALFCVLHPLIFTTLPTSNSQRLYQQSEIFAQNKMA